MISHDKRSHDLSGNPWIIASPVVSETFIDQILVKQEEKTVM